jgi:hypothetical protein
VPPTCSSGNPGRGQWPEEECGSERAFRRCCQLGQSNSSPLSTVSLSPALGSMTTTTLYLHLLPATAVLPCRCRFLLAAADADASPLYLSLSIRHLTTIAALLTPSRHAKKGQGATQTTRAPVSGICSVQCLQGLPLAPQTLGLIGCLPNPGSHRQFRLASVRMQYHVVWFTFCTTRLVRDCD